MSSKRAGKKAKGCNSTAKRSAGEMMCPTAATTTTTTTGTTTATTATADHADSTVLSLPGWYGLAITPHPKQTRLKITPTILSRFDLGNNIYTIDNFLLDLECQMWIDFGEATTFEQIAQKQDREYAHRQNGRIQILNDDVADSIFKRLKPFLPPSMDGLRPHSCSNNIRLYEYSVDQRFGKHVDESCRDERSGGVTKFTVLIYLSGATYGTETNSGTAEADDTDTDSTVLVGGETLFYTGSGAGRLVTSVSPSTGRLLLHAQGGKCLTHEGAAVSAGTKYVLRTDVVYKYKI
jgi:hypothetical protein